MKKLLLALPMMLVAGSLTAEPKPPVKQTPPAAKHTAPRPVAATPKAMGLKAEVVSIDAKAETLTYKSEGKTTTLKVDASAAKTLASLKAGEEVSLVFRQSSKGTREAISKITPVHVAG